MTDGAQAAVDAYQSIIDAYERKGKFPGIPTGLKNFDALTGGFCDGELIIIGARPAMGKTMFAQRIAEFAALSQNNHVAFFSLEMSAKEIMNRIFSQRADVKFRSLRFGTLDQEEFQRLGTVCYMPELSNLHICDKPAGLHEIRSHCRRLKHIGQCPRMIVIDYLQIIPMAEKRNGTRNDVISTATRELKMLAKEMNCPVICLSQLSRDSAKRPDKRPQLSDLRESGAIEQDADMVILLHREAYYDDKSSKKNIMEVIVAKARNGKTGTVEVGYQPEYMRIANIEYKNKDDKN